MSSAAVHARAGRNRTFDRMVRLRHDLVAVENGVLADVLPIARGGVAGLIRQYRLGYESALHRFNATELTIRLRHEMADAAGRIRATLRNTLSDLAPRWFGTALLAVTATVKPSVLLDIADYIRDVSAQWLRGIGAPTPLREAAVTFSVGVNVADLLRGAVSGVQGLFGAGYIDSTQVDELLTLFDAVLQRDTQAAVSALEQSIAAGEDLEAAIQRMQDALSGLEPRLSNAVTNAVQSVAADSEAMLAQLLHPATRYLKYVAMMDGRTCLVCATYARPPATYAANDPARPSIPVHPMCRCFYIPVLKGQPDPKDQDYDSWLRGQTAARQKAVLGPSRYALFAKGVKIERFVNRTGEVIKVADLPDPKRIPALYKQRRRRVRDLRKRRR